MELIRLTQQNASQYVGYNILFKTRGENIYCLLLRERLIFLGFHLSQHPLLKKDLIYVAIMVKRVINLFFKY